MSPQEEEWRWVAVDSKGSNKDGKTRQTIRKNAMKSFRRNERLERSRKYDEVRASSKSTSNHRDLQPNPALGLLGTAGKQERLYREPICGLDSFVSTTDGSSREAQRLLFHFINHIAIQLQPIGVPQDKNAITAFFIPQALQHPGALSAILFHSGAHIDALLNWPWTRTTLFYRGETIRLIKEHLASGGSEASDSLLTMVAFLAATGNVNGDVDSDHLHTRAVQTMVSMRGGLEAMSLTQAPLAMMLSIGDLIHATISGQPPSLEPPSIAANPLLPSLPPAFFSAVNPLPANSLPTPTTLTILTHAICTLSTVQIHLITSPTTSTSSILSFTNLSLSIEHRLLSLQFHHTPSHPEHLLDEATRHALLLCINTLFRTFRPSSPVLVASQRQLQSVLEKLNVSVLEKQGGIYREKRLLWALCVGGATCDADGRKWYVEKIVELLEEMNVRGETLGGRKVGIEELRECLRQFVWVARLDGAGFAALWDRVRDERLRRQALVCAPSER